MPTFEDLTRYFQKQVDLPWRGDLAPDYRVWILWYQQNLERRVRGRLHEFEASAQAAGHGWRHLDLAPEFGRWIGRHEYFNDLVEMPEELPGVLPDFADFLIDRVCQELKSCDRDDLLAVTGAGSLFGLMRISTLIGSVAPHIPGRLLVFFPGRHQAGVYRLLDAREGWNYRATPIPAVDAI